MTDKPTSTEAVAELARHLKQYPDVDLYRFQAITTLEALATDRDMYQKANGGYDETIRRQTGLIEERTRERDELRAEVERLEFDVGFHKENTTEYYKLNMALERDRERLIAAGRPFVSKSDIGEVMRQAIDEAIK